MDKQIWGKVGESGSAYGKEPKMLSRGYIKMNEPSPSSDHVAQEDGTWMIPSEKIKELKKRDYEVTTDPLVLELERLKIVGTDDEVAEVELELLIANAEIQEKYGEGSTVFITETGSHYHTDQECESLSGHVVKEVALSVGFKNYEACSLCASSE